MSFSPDAIVRYSPVEPIFQAFPKIPRFNRDFIVQEKIDGTNAAVVVMPEGGVFAQSRTRLITPEADNFGFAAWVEANKQELRKLGEGTHFGEWWGKGIQRGYGLDHRRFSLFHVADGSKLPACCYVVPTICTAPAAELPYIVDDLRRNGSRAVPGYMQPEGIVVWHTAARTRFKILCENDEIPKGIAEAA